MENHFWQDAPDSSATPPTAAQARDALTSLDDDGAILSKRVATPWWYHSTLGFIVAMFVTSQALPGGMAITLVALGVIALPLLTTKYSRRYGVTITQPAGPRSRRILLTTLGVALAAFLAALAIKLTGVDPWWVAFPAATAFAATVILGRQYDDALRREIAGDEDTGRRLL